VRVKEVLPESPALKAGIAPGDVILRVGDRPIATTEDVLDASFFLTADDATPIVVSRGGKQIEITVQPNEHPDEAAAQFKRIAPAFGPDMTMPNLESGK
jgi:regulator of sigma E protease